MSLTRYPLTLLNGIRQRGIPAVTSADRYHSLVLLGNFQRSLRDAKGRGLFQQFFGGDLSMLQQFQQQTFRLLCLCDAGATAGEKLAGSGITMDAPSGAKLLLS